jgi:3-oxoacyl-[acyl-carrier-protein] synthase-3
MEPHLRFSILSTATALPADRVEAAELDRRLALPPGTTLQRNSVKTRYFASDYDSSSALGAEALRKALDDGGLSILDLDAILFTSVLAENPMPTTSTLIHWRLGGRENNMVCMDLNASCAGMFRALEIAAAWIQTGTHRHVAIVATELGSRGLDWNDLDTATLFGDGAAAWIIGPALGDQGILQSSSVLLSSALEHATVLAGGTHWNVRRPPPSERDYFFRMNGKAMLKLARQYLPGLVSSLLEGTEVRLIVPHQASAIGLASLQKILQKQDNTIQYVDILSQHGNQVTASIGFALDHAIRAKRMQRGDEILLLGTAAGLSVHGIVLRY